MRFSSDAARQSRRLAIFFTLAAIPAVAWGAAAPPPQPAAPAPTNLHVDLAALDLKRDQVPDGKHYMATGPAQAYDAKSHDVGWYSHDTVMGRRTPTMHYGAHNLPTYAFGKDIPGSRGTLWTPALPISPKFACTFSYIHSYALADASRLALGVDRMTFSYSFDGKNWVDDVLPKPGLKLAWTTVTKAIPCQSHTELWLKWDFNTINGEHNNGRGWNLKSFDLQQK